MKDLITVDATRCQGDELCVSACPTQILEMSYEPPRPRLITQRPDVEELCIHCGHCVAVCPHDAFDHRSSPLAESPLLRPVLEITAESMEQRLLSRRSIRVFRPELIERATLERVISAARYAPSGHNRQPVHWLVISGAESIRELAGLVAQWMRFVMSEMPELAEELHLDRVVEAWDAGEDRICRSAPHIIVTHAPKDDRMAPPAGTIALASLELAAPSFGLGACWAGYFNTAASFFPPMQKALALPQGHAPLGSMMLGLPKLRYRRVPKRNAPPITWR